MGSQTAPRTPPKPDQGRGQPAVLERLDRCDQERRQPVCGQFGIEENGGQAAVKRLGDGEGERAGQKPGQARPGRTILGEPLAERQADTGQERPGDGAGRLEQLRLGREGAAKTGENQDEHGFHGDAEQDRYPGDAQERGVQLRGCGVAGRAAASRRARVAAHGRGG